MKLDPISADMLLGFSLGCVVGVTFGAITTREIFSRIAKIGKKAPPLAQSHACAEFLGLEESDFDKKARELQEAFKIDERGRQDRRPAEGKT